MFKNELHPEFLGLHSLNSFASHNSSSRSVMCASHISQCLVINGGEEKIVQSGLEKEFGKYTFSVKMPENGRIIKLIDRYPKGIDQDSLQFNPETIVIYENDETKEIDYFTIPYYASYHQFFGFKYALKDTIGLLNQNNAYIPKGTIFADSPSVCENSGYKYGINLNVAFMSLPSVSEDGIMISRKALEKLKFKIYETRVVEYGSKQFAINLYGNMDYYKPFPDIGEYLREDGLLMMLRDYDSNLSPIDMSLYDTLEPDYIFDKAVYVRSGKGKIIDIKVVSNNNDNKMLPEKMTQHASKYERALLRFHQEVIRTEEAIRYERKKKYGDGNIKLSPKFHRLVVEALAVTNHASNKIKQTLNLLYRKAPIDEYRIEFVIEYEITPDYGYKLSDLNGGKGVICKIVENEEDMPVDENGNRAEVVTGGETTIDRMNLARVYEHYFNATARDVGKRVKTILNANHKVTIDYLYSLPIDKIQQAYECLLGYYQIVSNAQYQFFKNQITDEEKFEHLKTIINDGVKVFYPIDRKENDVEVVKALEQYYPPTYGPVTYRGNSGELITTHNKIRIAPLYMILLDKIADDWSSVSTGKLQHFGVLSPITKTDKFSYPYRNSPVRTIGETEGRIFVGYCGREAMAEMMDRSCNPTTQRNIIWNILNAEAPGNIDNIVDRDFIPLGNHRPLQLVKHIMQCAGFIPVYEPEGDDK